MFDPDAEVGGLAHILLAQKDNNIDPDNYLKYANVSLKLMFNDLICHGCNTENIIAKVAGGANMFPSIYADDRPTIGKKNIESVLYVLQDELRVPVVAQDVGGNHGRTLEFNPMDGNLSVRSLLMGSKKL